MTDDNGDRGETVTTTPAISDDYHIFHMWPSYSHQSVDEFNVIYHP